MYPRRFALAGVVLFIWVLCSATLAAHLAISWGKEHTVYRQEKITNESYPNELAVHFGPPNREFAATALGLPDGVCDEWTNKVSWRVIVCWGGQPEVMRG